MVWVALFFLSFILHLFIHYLDPTLRDGGKPEVIRTLKKQHSYSSVVMVGDGVTDMQVSATRMRLTVMSLQLEADCTCIVTVGVLY